MNYSSTASPVSPVDVSLREFTISADTTLVWSYSGLDDANTAARIMIVSASTTGLSLLMPPANEGELGWSTVVTNVGSNTFAIENNIGGSITSIAAGETKIIELRTQASIAGTWLPVTLGATGSAADASLLAGYGLKAITTTLNSNVLGTDFSASQSFNVNDRASFWNWTGGVGIATLDLVAALGNGWWIGFRNSGSGILSVTPTAPDFINADSSQVLNPGDSCFVFCTGGAFFTVGLGKDVVVSDSQLIKNVAGGTDVTLTSTEYANNIIKFTGLLTANINVIFPTSIKNYFLSNVTTGAFTLTAKTAAGTGVEILQNGASIVTVDGTDLNDATNGSGGGGGGTVTSITAGTGLTGGVITTTGTVALANTAVVAGTYGGASVGIPSIIVDGQGRLTAASNTGNIYDNVLRVQDNVDPTKQVAFECSGITTGTTRILSVADSDGTIALLSSPAFTGTPTAPTPSAADNSTKLATTAYVDSSVAGNVYKSNLVFNPSGAVYQRSIAATSDDAYFADRWYILSQSGSVTPSQLTDPEDGYPYGVRITQSQVTSQRFGFAQIIEGKNCKFLRGQSASLCPRIRASSSQAIRYAIVGWTGTEDTVTSDIVNDWTSSNYTAGNFFLASNVTVIATGSVTPTAATWTSLTTITGSCGTTFNNIIVFVWTEAVAAQNFTMDFDYIMLNQGSFIAPFEYLPINQSLSYCYRYYEKTGFIFFSGVTGNPGYWKSTKRITPSSITATPSSGSGAVITAIDANAFYQTSLNSVFVTGYVSTDTEL